MSVAAGRQSSEMKLTHISDESHAVVGRQVKQGLRPDLCPPASSYLLLQPRTTRHASQFVVVVVVVVAVQLQLAPARCD
jgi:hypothetical protein